MAAATAVHARPHTVRVRRFAAAFLDGVIALILALVPAALAPMGKGRLFGIGLLLGAAYLLLRDGIPYAEWGPRSLGKRWLGLRPYQVGGAALSWQTSARRNATLGGALAVWALVYLAGGFRGLPFDEVLMWAAVAVVAVEAGLVAAAPDGRRIGDRLAETRVVEARA